MGADATPELTETVLTLIVAFAWFTVGVTVTLLVPLATLSVYVYVPVENDGLRVPELIVSPERAASALNADTLILVEAVVEVSVMSRVPAALPALRDSVAEVAFAVICETIDAPVPPDMVKTVVLPTGHAVFTPVMVTVLPVLLCSIPLGLAEILAIFGDASAANCKPSILDPVSFGCRLSELFARIVLKPARPRSRIYIRESRGWED